MNVIWIEKFPLSPSVNTSYETNVTKAYKINKKGQRYLGFKTSRRRSDELITFQTKCLNFRNLNIGVFNKIIPVVKSWVEQGYALRIDTWFVIEHSRIITKDGKHKQLDVDNRRKSAQDSLCTILEIDDKHVFSGIIEKVTCNSKDLESCLIRITPMKARTLEEIQNLKTAVGSTLPY